MEKRERTQLDAGTMVEVVDPNYKTRTVGALEQPLSTGHYYEGIKLRVGNGRESVSGYISIWKREEQS